MQQADPGKRRARRGALQCLCALVALYVLAAGGGCINPSLPSDLLLNLPSGPAHDEGLEASEPTLVVLQHGLWRSSGAMWRMERSLEKHGYEVLNDSYPSTRGTVEEHAARLRTRLEEHLARRGGEPPRICFVGHSLGGLVIRAYLNGEGARESWACVFLATPHRGAVLAELRRERWWFRLLMGKKSALQLVPGDPLYAALDALACPRVGVLYGGKGDGEGWNEDIPGDDDGTVATNEAQLPEQTADLRLPYGHTRLGFAKESIRQTLVFLRRERFDEDGAR